MSLLPLRKFTFSPHTSGEWKMFSRYNKGLPSISEISHKFLTHRRLYTSSVFILVFFADTSIQSSCSGKFLSIFRKAYIIESSISKITSLHPAAFLKKILHQRWFIFYFDIFFKIPIVLNPPLDDCFRLC